MTLSERVVELVEQVSELEFELAEAHANALRMAAEHYTMVCEEIVVCGCGAQFPAISWVTEWQKHILSLLPSDAARAQKVKEE